VELDVANRDGSLAPGIYPSVKWPIRRTRPELFVSRTSVVTTAERTFVVPIAEWVEVRKGTVDVDQKETKLSEEPPTKSEKEHPSNNVGRRHARPQQMAARAPPHQARRTGVGVRVAGANQPAARIDS
jgi:hypothetical protein